MILKKVGHIALLLSIASGLFACRSGEEELVPTKGDKNRYVTLSMSVAAPEPVAPPESRALIVDPDDDNFFEEPDSRFERINTLRIIILRGTGAPGDSIGFVEHNKFFRLTESGLTYYDDMVFKVVGGEKKKIYLIANEKTVPYDFTKIEAKTRFPEKEVEDLKLLTDENNILYNNAGATPEYIPMTEIYDNVDVKLPQTPEDYYQTLEPMFLTRAAVKFTINLAVDKNFKGKGLNVSKFTFNSLGNMEYLFPRNTIYSPAKESPAIKNPDGFTQAPEDLRGHFITAYDVPSEAVNSNFDFPLPGKGVSLTAGSEYAWYAALYFAETKKGKMVTGNEKPFSMSVTLSYTRIVEVEDENNEGETIKKEEQVESTLEFKELPNLPILPRNTHVLVNVLIKPEEQKLTAELDLVPYIGVTLKPIFGK